MPTTELTGDDLGSGEINVLNLLVRCGLCASKGEARRLVQQGGITVEDKKVDSIDASFGCQEFHRRRPDHPQGQKGVPPGRADLRIASRSKLSPGASNTNDIWDHPYML